MCVCVLCVCVCVCVCLCLCLCVCVLLAGLEISQAFPCQCDLTSPTEGPAAEREVHQRLENAANLMRKFFKTTFVCNTIYGDRWSYCVTHVTWRAIHMARFNCFCSHGSRGKYIGGRLTYIAVCY